MKKLFFLLSSLYALGLFSQSDPEYPTSPNWLYAITAPDVDYYEICESVDAKINNYPDDQGRKLFNRWADFWADRVGDENNPGSFIPAFNAQYGQMQNPFCNNSGSNNSNWNNLGPITRPLPGSPPTGTTGLGVAVRVVVDKQHDPSLNTVYACTAASGLWKTTNAMDAVPNWECITDNTAIPVLGIQDVVISPTDPNTLLIATGIGPQSLIYKYGVGLLKSEDGGISWQTTNLVYTPAQNFNSICHNLLAHPTDPNIYYALCDNRIF